MPDVKIIIRPNSVGLDVTMAFHHWETDREHPLHVAGRRFCENVGLIMANFKLTPADGDTTLEYATFSTGTGRDFTTFIPPEK